MLNKKHNYLSKNTTMKNKFLPVFTGIMLCTFCSFAQTNTFPATGSAGIGTTTPAATALLDMVSTSKGLLIPRMTKTQRDAIAAPATGLMIFQTNSQPGFYYFDGAVWSALKPKNTAWLLTGNSGTN